MWRESANESRPLVHSQYLHRESIYLADEQFVRGVSLRAHIVMEKIMASYSQVEPYVSAVGRSDGRHDLGQRCKEVDSGGISTGGKEPVGQQDELFAGGVRHAAAGQVEDDLKRCMDESGVRYSVVILATSADLVHCKLGNKARRRSGHVITQAQLEVQYRRYTATLAELVARMDAAGADDAPDLAGVGLVVVDSNRLLDEIARGAPLAEAQRALSIQYARFLPP